LGGNNKKKSQRVKDGFLEKYNKIVVGERGDLHWVKRGKNENEEKRAHKVPLGERGLRGIGKEGDRGINRF